jgi:pimeloyl-ACP methyl ester carboxylesterase
MAVNSSPLSREYELRSLNLPTLIIHGSLDPFFPIEHAYALQKAITLSSLVTIKDMGHFFHGSFRKEVLSAILLHLKKHDV